MFTNTYLNLLAFAVLMIVESCGNAHSEFKPTNVDTAIRDQAHSSANASVAKPIALLDTSAFHESMKRMLNGDSSGKWFMGNPYPRAGAVLPFKRVIAYYGNLYSTQMGILGEYPRPQMLAKLKEEVKRWEKADPQTPVQPALHYIAVTAQASPGSTGTYRLRMPFKQIDTIMKWAKEIDALVFLDIQVGLSTIQKELPEFEPYLKLPNVHLGIDPEFSMKGGQAPGKVIGSFDAADVNYVSEYLSGIVKKYDLPPKILVVHRFTQGMLTNAKSIRKNPEVQIVAHMDGWGNPVRKIDSYQYFILREPIQFTGFKIFYKNDIKQSPNRLLTPEELVKLKPMPIYIQYQ